MSILSGTTRQHTPALLHRLLECGEVPNNVALISPGDPRSTITFVEFNAKAEQIARFLVHEAQNLKPNSDGDFIVAVVAEPTADLLVLLLAIAKSGAAYVPLDPTFPPNRMKHILTNSSPMFVITDTENENLQQVKGYLKIFNWTTVCEKSAQFSSGILQPEETIWNLHASEDWERVMMVLYTSGSTGTPKGVRLSHRAVLNRLRWQWREMPWSDNEVGAFKTALTFVDSVAEMWSPLLQGRPLVIVPKAVKKDPEQFLKLLVQEHVSRLVLVPSLLRSLCWVAENAKQKLPQTLKLWICSGETLPASLVQSYFENSLGGTMANFYGSTEVMGDVTFHVMRSAAGEVVDGKVPIGQCVDNTKVFLLNENLELVENGTVGEIYVGGENLALGYVGLPNSDKFVDNPYVSDHPDCPILYRTGDFGRLSQFGSLLYEGRTDSQVKVRGHRVDLSEVQTVLQSFPNIDKAVVLAHDPGMPDQAILAYFTSTSEAVTSGSIGILLKNSLMPYMLPDHVLKLDHFPLLPNGKTDRQTLLASYRENRAKKGTIDTTGIDSSSIDKAVVLLETVLESLESSAGICVTLDSNFFEIGGNSLNAVWAVTRLRDQGYYIGVGEFLSSKSLKDVFHLLKLLENANSDETSGSEPEQFTSETLNNSHKDAVAQIIAISFSQKADLERWTGGKYEHFIDLIGQLWEILVQKGYSFIVRNMKGEIIAAALNFDGYDEPEDLSPSKEIMYVLEFLDYIEIPQKKNLPQGIKQIYHSFMMGTRPELNSSDNVAVVKFMEEENIRRATAGNFAGLLTTNTNPLTMQICEDLLGYQPLYCYPVNQYVARDGTKPFGLAPDSQTVVCSWKKL